MSSTVSPSVRSGTVEAVAAIVMEERADTTMTRIAIKALEAARIARAYYGERLSDYISRVVLEAANRDIEEGHKKRLKEKK